MEYFENVVTMKQADARFRQLARSWLTGLLTDDQFSRVWGEYKDLQLIDRALKAA